MVLDQVVREVVLGWSHEEEEDNIQTLVSLGISHEHAQELANEISNATVLEEIGTDKNGWAWM